MAGCWILYTSGVTFQIEWQANKSNEIYLEKLQVTEDNRTVSTLELAAKREMHGGKLSCKVENPLVPNSQIKDGQKLQIHCKHTPASITTYMWEEEQKCDYF